ncbi:MAG: TetR/AcrR family transcriptional regulator [Polaribacter sp.]|nr:TetR/AcrR family transcriptional regulator [Polaribacter sp.]MDG1812268.1 TetR/AcrR family transcriptional regulator [Polaribacter sp.]MDG1994448.1 TetR/AcrR family transcriptional regulator [Polaribacter sp.]
MKNTKGTILNTALKLFNSQGLSKVKLRTIANNMGISQGNLNYHFKKREDVIETLYFRLVENINQNMSNNYDSTSFLKALFVMSKSVMLDLYMYRFIMLDFVQIMRENEKIKNHFQELKQEREKQFLSFFDILITSGLMRKELLPNEYKNLYIRLQVLGDFWISSAEIDKIKLTKKSITKYSEIMNQTIYPYLTEKGKSEYHLIVKTI